MTVKDITALWNLSDLVLRLWSCDFRLIYVVTVLWCWIVTIRFCLSKVTKYFYFVTLLKQKFLFSTFTWIVLHWATSTFTEIKILTTSSNVSAEQLQQQPPHFCRLPLPDAGEWLTLRHALRHTLRHRVMLAATPLRAPSHRSLSSRIQMVEPYIVNDPANQITGVCSGVVSEKVGAEQQVAIFRKARCKLLTGNNKIQIKYL